MLEQFRPYVPKEISLSLADCYRDFDLSKIALTGEINPEEWSKLSYKYNTGFQENLKYRSESGLYTRSKAEADIATKLEQEQFHFRYEPQLTLGKHTFYPDFCALHRISHRPIYWEHFGAMDQPRYAHSACEKLRIYAEHGYYLGDNLIMTWETGKEPLNFPHINDRIQKYLL